MDDWGNKTDAELVEGTQAGQVVFGRFATVEMMRRLKDSLLAEAQATEKLNTRILLLTWVAVFLTAVQAIAAGIEIYRFIFK